MLLRVRGSGLSPGPRRACAAVAAAFLLQILPVDSFGLPPPQADLDQAVELYDFAAFDQAIEGLRDLIDSGSLSRADQVRAYDYLGRAYVKRGLGGDRDLAIWSFQQMLGLDPSKELTALEVPPDIVAVFEEARAGMPATTREEAPPPAKEEELDFSQTTELVAPEEKGGNALVSYGLLGGTVAFGALWLIGNGQVSSKNDDITAAIGNGTITTGLFDDADSAASRRDVFAVLTVTFATATLGYFLFVKRPQGRGFFSAGLESDPDETGGSAVSLDLDLKNKKPYLGLAIQF